MFMIFCKYEKIIKIILHYIHLQMQTFEISRARYYYLVLLFKVVELPAKGVGLRTIGMGRSNCYILIQHLELGALELGFGIELRVEWFLTLNFNLDQVSLVWNLGLGVGTVWNSFNWKLKVFFHYFIFNLKKKSLLIGESRDLPGPNVGPPMVVEMAR